MHEIIMDEAGINCFKWWLISSWKTKGLKIDHWISQQVCHMWSLFKQF